MWIIKILGTKFSGMEPGYFFWQFCSFSCLSRLPFWANLLKQLRQSYPPFLVWLRTWFTIASFLWCFIPQTLQVNTYCGRLDFGVNFCSFAYRFSMSPFLIDFLSNCSLARVFLFFLRVFGFLVIYLVTISGEDSVCFFGKAFSDSWVFMSNISLFSEWKFSWLLSIVLSFRAVISAPISSFTHFKNPARGSTNDGPSFARAKRAPASSAIFNLKPFQVL